MKKIRQSGSLGLATLCAAAALLSGCVTYVEPPPQPQPVVADAPAEPVPDYVEPATDPSVVVIQSESDFYQPLDPYGRWVVIADYGRCWVPSGVGPDWRPYCYGHWQRTDAGWYWVSDEQWGWATYHYGRWALDVNYGWVWMPQTVWAPSWVCWREGGGYTGWAPLPPEAVITVRGDFSFRPESMPPRAFCFVEERRLLETHRPQTVIINNTVIINKTVNITKIQVVNKTVVNEGPRPENIELASGHKVPVVPVHQVRVAQEAKVAAAMPHKSPAIVNHQPHPQSAAHPNNPAPNHNVQAYNPPHPATPSKPAAPEQTFARPHETPAPTEIKKPAPQPEHVAAAKPVVEPRKPEPQPQPHRVNPQPTETPRPAPHPQFNNQQTPQAQHEAAPKKPASQQKQPQKHQPEEKKRPEEEKPSKPQ